MNCSHYTLLLHDLLDGTLSPERVQEMDAHAALCSDCSIQYEQLRCIVEDLQTLDVDIEVPQTFSHAWQKAVKEEAMHKKNPHRFTAWRAWIVAAAAIICLTGGTELLRSGYLPGTAPYQSRVGLSRAETTTRDADTPVMPRNRSMPMRANSETASSPLPRTLQPAPADSQGNAILEDPMQAQKIVRTVRICISSTAFDTDMTHLLSLSTDAGGYVSYQSISGEPIAQNPDGGRSGSFTLRIPTDRLDGVTASILQIGTLESQEMSSQDVSDQYYDTQGRLATYEAQRDRLQALLVDAKNVADIVEIENHLSEVQYQIESLTSALQRLDRQVNYSEVSVQLTERAERAALRPAAQTLGHRISESFFASLNGAISFLRDMAVFVVVAAPWAIGIVGLGLLLYVFIRWMRIHKK